MQDRSGGNCYRGVEYGQRTFHQGRTQQESWIKMGKKNQHAVVLLNTVNKSELEKNIITGDKTG